MVMFRLTGMADMLAHTTLWLTLCANNDIAVASNLN